MKVSLSLSKLENRPKSKKAITITIVITIDVRPGGEGDAFRNDKGEVDFRVLARFITHETHLDSVRLFSKNPLLFLLVISSPRGPGSPARPRRARNGDSGLLRDSPGIIARLFIFALLLALTRTGFKKSPSLEHAFLGRRQ
jgi:hypothetical protein